MLDALKVIILGIVEGITEWLPVSSTGHLILVGDLLAPGLSDEFMEMFNVVIQLGAIIAVVVLYFHKLNPFSPKKIKKQKLLTYRAQEIPVEEGGKTAVFACDLAGNEPRELMNLLLEKGAEICGVFAGTDEEGYRYVIGSRTEDVRPIGKMMNDAFEGRGGGKPVMVQGTLRGKKEEMKEFWETI